jgi:hypothetical protein
VGDEARVSDASRRALELENRARHGDSRSEKLEAARSRLASGELDKSGVYEDVAERLLGGGAEPEF